MQTAERREPHPGPPALEPAAPPPPDLRPRPSRPLLRVTGMGLWSVAKVSLVFYAAMGLALVTTAVLLAVASEASGLTGHLDRFARSVLGLKSVSLRPVVVAELAAVLAGALAVIGVIVHVLGAFVYNRIADLTGGMGVELGRGAKSPRV